MSDNIKTKIKIVNKSLKFCNFKILSETTDKLKNYFYYKDLVPESFCSSHVNKCSYGTASYIGKTYYKYMKIRVLEHYIVSPENL